LIGHDQFVGLVPHRLVGAVPLSARSEGLDTADRSLIEPDSTVDAGAHRVVTGRGASWPVSYCLASRSVIVLRAMCNHKMKITAHYQPVVCNACQHAAEDLMNISSCVVSAIAVVALAVACDTAEAAAANCGSARVCALVHQGGGVTRAKNVAKVTNPSTGVYCITPKSGTITLSQVTPLTTVEWGSSGANNLLALYSDSKIGCPSSALEVHTFDGFGNANNFASFFIVVN
jgi:hypothetical protein